MILRGSHQNVPRCRSSGSLRNVKSWQREQRSGAGLLVKCLPTAWPLPVPPQRFRHVPLQGQLSRLYNLSRPFEGFSLSSVDLRCLRCVIGDGVPLEEPAPHCPREWPWRVAGCCNSLAGAGAPPMRNVGVIRGKRLKPRRAGFLIVPVKVANASRRC